MPVENEERYCKCGCGQVVTNGRKYIKGHNLRKFKAKKEDKQLDYFERLGKFE